MWCFPPLPSPARSLGTFLAGSCNLWWDRANDFSRTANACRFSAPEKTPNAELRFFSSSSSFSFCFLASCFSNDRTQAQPRISCTSWLKVEQYLLIWTWSHDPMCYIQTSIFAFQFIYPLLKRFTSSCACEQTPIPNSHHLPATHFG